MKCEIDLRVAVHDLDSQTLAEPDIDAPDYMVTNTFVDVPVVQLFFAASYSQFLVAALAFCKSHREDREIAGEAGGRARRLKGTR